MLFSGDPVERLQLLRGETNRNHLGSFGATQALLPTLTEALGVSPSQAALTVSAATGTLAVCVVPASILSEKFGRGRVLTISAAAATAVGLLLPLSQTIGRMDRPARPPRRAHRRHPGGSHGVAERGD